MNFKEAQVFNKYMYKNTESVNLTGQIKSKFFTDSL